MNKPRYNWVSPYTVKEKFFFWKKGYDAHETEPPVLLTKACECWYNIANFFNRKINYVKIDKWDTWSMDTTLSPIILPMLKQLRETKHGSPFIEDADVPEELRDAKVKRKKGVKKGPIIGSSDVHMINEDDEALIHKRWNWVLDQMIWSFEELCKEDPDYVYFVDGNWNKEAYMTYHDKVQVGLTLFGKYYRCLWD